MTGSQTKKALTFVLTGALGLWLAGAPAHAQAVTQDEAVPQVRGDASDDDEADEASGAPIGLIGGGFLKQEEEKSGDYLETLRAAPGAEDGVAVGALDSLDTVVLGLIDESDGGFGPGLWAGSRRETVDSYLPDIPARSPSRAMRELTYRLLTTRSNAPAGPKSTEGSLLSLRLTKLYDAGFLKAAEDLARQDLTQDGDPEITLTLAKLALLKNDVQGACGQAARMRGRSSSDAWLKVRAYCYLAAGDPVSARFTADLLREDGYDDPVFYGFMSAAAEGTELAVEDFGTPDALTLAFAGQAKHSLPTAALQAATLPVQLEVATTGLAGGAAVDLMQTRLPVAEAAARAGALEPRKLALLYRNVPFLQSETLSLVEKVYENPGPEARAALFQYVEAQEVPNARASQIKKALDVGRLSGTYEVALNIYGPLIGELDLAAEFAPMAEDFIPSLYAIQHYAQGEEWLDLALFRALNNNPDARALSSRLLTYDTCRHIRNLPGDGISSAWEPMLRLSGPRDDKSFAVAVHEVRLMELLGVEIPMEARQLIIARPLEVEGQMPPSAVMSGLDAASRSGRLGETVMFALIALGEEGPQGAPTAVVERVVSALARVGLFTEAQDVAIESLIARAR